MGAGDQILCIITDLAQGPHTVGPSQTVRCHCRLSVPCPLTLPDRCPPAAQELGTSPGRGATSCGAGPGSELPTHPPRALLALTGTAPTLGDSGLGCPPRLVLLGPPSPPRCREALAPSHPQFLLESVFCASCQKPGGLAADLGLPGEGQGLAVMVRTGLAARSWAPSEQKGARPGSRQIQHPQRARWVRTHGGRAGTPQPVE